MTTLAEHIIVAGPENRPPMLEKSMYDSWASRIRIFIKGNKNGRMMLDLIDEGPLVYPTVVGEDGQTRPKKYFELTEAQQLQDDCDVQATNIILQFVTDVKLAKSLYTTNYGQLYAYLNQHERHANEVSTFKQSTQNVFQSQKSGNHSRWKSRSSTSSRKTNSEFAATGNRGITTTSKGNYAAGQAKVVKCYNCLGEGHMAKQCTQPKRLRSSMWYKEKLMLVKA
ncbi:copia protein [Tanacetum coccineum]